MMHKQMEDLIKSVKKHRALWDTSIKSYKDQTKRLHAWNMVSKECRLSKESAKSKWRGLRDTYIKSLKAEKRTSAKKRKKYCNADLMSFMEPIISHLIPRAAKNKPTEAVKDKVSPSVIVVNDQQEASERQPEKGPVQSSESKNDYHSACLWKRPAEQTNATDMLFLSYSKTLKSFSKRRQILLKNKIAELFLHAELEEITLVKGESITPSVSNTAINENVSDSPFDLLSTTPCKIEIHRRPNSIAID